MEKMKNIGIAIAIPSGPVCADRPGEGRQGARGPARRGADHVEVIAAGTAGEGFRLLKERAVDLVLLDLNLPDAGGLEFIRRVHDEGIAVDILPVTVGGSQEVLPEA